MSTAIAFVLVVGAFLVAGELHRRWDRTRNDRVVDEAGSGAATLALARFESRQLLTHPTWLILTAAVFALTTFLLLGDDSGSVSSGTAIVSFAIVAVAAAGLGLIVSMHRIGTRSVRNRTVELEASMPTAPTARTGGLLVASLVVAPVALLLFGFALVVTQLAYPLTPMPSLSSLVEVIPGVVIVVGGALVGVITSRWLPVAVAPVIGIAAVIFLTSGPGHLHPRDRWLRPFVEADFGGRFDIRPLAAHLTLLLGVLALAVCIALAAHGPRRATLVATACSVAVIAGAGWVATRPPSEADVQRVAAELERPTDHQLCERRGDVSYCVFDGAEGWIDHWQPAVDAVLGQVPEDARPARLEVVQRPTVDLRRYLREVQDAIDPATVWAADGRVHPGMSLERSDVPDMSVAWQTAALAVGLPPAVDWAHPGGCLAGGQARIVLAHLLAARATPTTREGFALVADWVRTDGRQVEAVPMDLEGDYSADSPQGEGAEVEEGERLAADGRTPREQIAVAGASGWGTDVLAADALLAADRARVDAVISAHWDELVDPTTPTARLAELAGLDPFTTSPSAILVQADHPNACA